MPSKRTQSIAPAPHAGELSSLSALVTGAGGELGGEIAASLLRAGASVAWVGRRRERLIARAQSLRAPLERCLFAAADVRSERDAARAVRSVLRRFGRVDILVNNAGARGPTAPLGQIALAEWREVIDTNLTGAFLFSRECLPHMLRQRQGRIINISTVVSRWGYPLRAAYAASKAALNSLTLTLAQEAGASNVTVNAICPGPVGGPALDGVLAARAKALGISVAKMRTDFMRPAALGHAVTPEDISSLVVFLCSNRARNITGQIIDVSAGYGVWPGA